jgi:Ca2+-binding EF-hand superfamily protein
MSVTLEDAFDVLDYDQDNNISAVELASMLPLLGVRMSREEVLGFISKFDADGDGGLNFVEFQRIFEAHKRPMPRRSRAIGAK